MVIRYDEPSSCQAKGAHKIFVGRVIHSKALKDLAILPSAAAGVLPNGTIAFVEDDFDLATLKQHHPSFATADVIHLKPSQFLFPGLVDTHLHASQWPNLALGMEGTLREWCENYTDPMEASYSDNEKAKRVYSDVVKTTLQLGTTTVAYNTTIHAEASNILAEAAFKAGQRTIVGKMCITVGSTRGNWEDSTQVSLAASKKTLDFIRELDPEGRLVRSCVQPRGGPYCPPELMRGLGDQCEEYGAYVQAHMCETHMDVGMYPSLSHQTIACLQNPCEQIEHLSCTNSTLVTATCI
jgi:guanine deaminase